MFWRNLGFCGPQPCGPTAHCVDSRSSPLQKSVLPHSAKQKLYHTQLVWTKRPYVFFLIGVETDVESRQTVGKIKVSDWRMNGRKTANSVTSRRNRTRDPKKVKRKGILLF